MPCQAVDVSHIRLKPKRKDHVWSYDFVHRRTDDGRAFRTLNILDEFSHECLAIRVKRKLNSTNVVNALTDLFILPGTAIKTSCRALAMSIATKTGVFCAIVITVIVGLLCGVVCAKPL